MDYQSMLYMDPTPMADTENSEGDMPRPPKTAHPVHPSVKRAWAVIPLSAGDRKSFPANCYEIRLDEGAIHSQWLVDGFAVQMPAQTPESLPPVFGMCGRVAGDSEFDSALQIAARHIQERYIGELNAKQLVSDVRSSLCSTSNRRL